MSIILDGTNGITTPSGAVYNGLQSGTSQATASGTSVTFTGIPAWAKRITVMLNGVSTNGTSNLLVQVGSGSATSSGYLGNGTTTAGTLAATSYTTGFGLGSGNSTATTTLQGSMTITNIAGTTYLAVGTFAQNSTACMFTAGGVTLGGLLDRVILTTVNGTDTFDAGTANLIYE